MESVLKADTELKERLHFVYLWHHLKKQAVFCCSSDCLRCFGDVFTAWWTMWSAARRAGGRDLRTCWGAEGRKQWVSPLLINTTCLCQKETLLLAVLDVFMCWFLCVLLTTTLQSCARQDASALVARGVQHCWLPGKSELSREPSHLLPYPEILFPQYVCPKKTDSALGAWSPEVLPLETDSCNYPANWFVLPAFSLHRGW